MDVFQQAKHDGLCGFYAVLNAFRHLQRQAPEYLALENDDQAFFDGMVDALFTLNGVKVTILKGHPKDGGLDVNYIRAMSYAYARKNRLAIEIEQMKRAPKLTFAERYRSSYAKGVPFALIVLARDGGHWVAVGSRSLDVYDLLDQGKLIKKRLSDRTQPLQGMHGLVISIKMAEATGQDN